MHIIVDFFVLEFWKRGQCERIYLFTNKHIPVKTSGTVKQCYKDTKAYVILAFCHTDLHT